MSEKKAPEKPSEKAPGGGIDPEMVRELAAILRDTGLTEIEVEQGDTRLRLARETFVAAAAPAMVHAAAPPLAMAAPLPAAPTPAPGAAPAPAADLRHHPGMVPAPMVGTAYLAPEPGAKAFVAVGDTVAEGQTLLVIEAMKTFNPIPAPRSGKVTQVLVADSQPVEFGEPLMIIE